MDLVYVKWTDAGCPGTDWTDISEMASEPEAGSDCRSVGWIVFEDDDCIVLCPYVAVTDEEAEEGVGRSECAILKSSIVEQVVISKGFSPFVNVVAIVGLPPEPDADSAAMFTAKKDGKLTPFEGPPPKPDQPEEPATPPASKGVATKQTERRKAETVNFLQHADGPMSGRAIMEYLSDEMGIINNDSTARDRLNSMLAQNPKLFKRVGKALYTVVDKVEEPPAEAAPVGNPGGLNDAEQALVDQDPSDLEEAGRERRDELIAKRDRVLQGASTATGAGSKPLHTTKV